MPVFCCLINKTSGALSGEFRQTLYYNILRKSFQWESKCCMRTDITNLIVAFYNISKTPSKGKQTLCSFDVCLSVNRCICVEKKRLLDAIEWIFALIICSTCFGHFYAHHQELETIRVLLPPTVCDALVAGCWSGAGQPAMRSRATSLVPDA